MALDESRYVADVLADMSRREEGPESHILFKRKIFRDGDADSRDAVFVHLSYVQARRDYMGGNYPVGREDAVQLLAYQVAAEHGAPVPQDIM